MPFLAYLLDTAINIYVILIIVQVAMSWLIAFEVVNAHSPQARNLMALLEKITEPLYRPIRRFVPPIGGIDLTPLIVIIGISFAGKILTGALLAL
ncbi:MAG: YggT family protein [Alphaproteobacteria bacterium]|nr:YggT family protein [Alphaproteobacteria bacterium]